MVSNFCNRLDLFWCYIQYRSLCFLSILWDPRSHICRVVKLMCCNWRLLLLFSEHWKLCESCLIRTFIADAINLAADSDFHLRAIFGACLHMVGDLTKDCINGIHLVDNKRSGLRKLFQLKLAFCLEQLFSLAKLAYEFDCTGDETDTNSICIAMLKSCHISIAAVVKDSNMQVTENLSSCHKLVQLLIVKALNSIDSNICRFKLLPYKC